MREGIMREGAMREGAIPVQRRPHLGGASM